MESSIVTVKAKPLLSLFLLLSCLIAPAFAQNFRGAIRGRIIDSSQRVVAGAPLKIIQEETNETRTATSDANGQYTFTLLPPGAYRLEVER